MKSHARTHRQAEVSLDELGDALGKLGIVVPRDASVRLMEADGENPRRLVMEWDEAVADQDIDLPSLLSK